MKSLGTVPALAARIGWGALSCLLVAGVARAAGTDIPDQGSVAAARGGAYVADASDASAFYYNPAGLAQHTGLSFNLDLSLINHQVSFLRTDASGNPLSIGGKTEVTADNSSGFFPLPMASVAYGTKVLDRTLAVGLGFYAPPAIGAYNYPAPDYTTTTVGGTTEYVNDPRIYAPNRYTLVDSKLLIVYPQLSLAYEVIPKSPDNPVWLSVAGSLQYIYSQIHIQQSVFNALSVFYSGHPANCDPTVKPPGTAMTPACGPQGMIDESPTYDALATLDVKSSGPQFTGNLSALMGIGEYIQVGAFFQFGYWINDTGTLNLDFSNINNTLGFNAVQNSNAATLSLHQPAIGRLGVLVKPMHDLRVELDGVYERWSGTKEIILTPNGITVDVQALKQTLTPQPIVQNVDFQDAFSVRLGGEYGFEAGIPWKVRLGGLYETSAVPQAQTRIDFPDLGGAYVTAGVGAGLGPVEVNLAFAYGIPTSRTVTNSNLYMPTSDSFLQPSAVGNGQYTSSVIHLGISVAGHFGG